MVSSETERYLGDDVALDFIRSGVDRGLAKVAVARRERSGELVEVDASVDRCKRLRQRADRLHHQLGQRLLDLGALDLQHRDFGAGSSSTAQLVEEAQVGDRQREQLDFDARELVTEARILGERPAIMELLGCERLEL